MEKKAIITNGYAYPFITDEALFGALPSLTYISAFSYGLSPQLELISLEDENLVAAAEQTETGALMTLTAMTPEGSFDGALATALFRNTAAQDRYLLQVIDNLQAKKMKGVDFDFEYVPAQSRDDYTAFVSKTREILNPMGYVVTAALAAKTASDQPGILYQGHDYYGMGKAANYILLMTYEWGYAYGPPMAVAPLNKVREVLEYGITQIDPGQILLGIPNYGYDWTLPYIQGTSKARKVTNPEALALAETYGSEIRFDAVSMSPYFTYYDEDGSLHEVWFEDEQSYRAKFRLIYEYALAGMGIWNMMSYDPVLLYVINDMFSVFTDPEKKDGG